MLSRQCLVGGDEVCRQLVAGCWHLGGGGGGQRAQPSFTPIDHDMLASKLSQDTRWITVFGPMYLESVFYIVNLSYGIPFMCQKSFAHSDARECGQLESV